MTNLQNAAPIDSKGFISGMPEIVKYAKFLAKELPYAVRLAMIQALKEEEQLLRTDAGDSSTGWADLQSNISIAFDEKNEIVIHGVTGNSAAAIKATDLEYGVPGKNAASPLLRSFVKEREKDLGDLISEKVDKILKDKYK